MKMQNCSKYLCGLHQWDQLDRTGRRRPVLTKGGSLGDYGHDCKGLTMMPFSGNLRPRSRIDDHLRYWLMVRVDATIAYKIIRSDIRNGLEGW